ncbi:MAG: helix-turn-helix domain-containing protein [Thiobacillus sp.]|nr:helix-turn-helix domain-containing protein [Thiobacillus sp.]MDP2979874.1 helix-turn-helix domain-containing protein [Thiobacillus sp.]
MSESGQPSVGQILRDAREAQGITLEDAAMRLRLMQRQVEAMETDDFESLDPPVFARGFVRNYARLLGLAPEALLACMAGAPAEPAEVSHAAPPPPHSWLSSPWLIPLLLGLLVLVAVPVALYWWLNSAGEDDTGKQASSAAQTRSTPVAVPAPVTEPAEAALPAVEVAPVAPALPAAGTSEPAAAEAPVAPEAPAINGVLHLEFGDEAWVEIKDGSGRMLHRQLNPAGTKADIPGQPPFEVVIGNAAQVRLTYNGRPIDLEPFIEVTVARFTLEE